MSSGPISPFTIQSIAGLIRTVKRQRVVLDFDVAKLYGVATRDVNRAVKNNPEKFLKGYVIELEKKDLRALRGKISSANLTKRRNLPKGFTEKGLYMLATILKSPQATRATLQIVETFTRVRKFSQVAKSLAQEKNKNKQKSLLQKSGVLISEILNHEFAQDTTSETTIELNLAMIKIKHTIKKGTSK